MVGINTVKILVVEDEASLREVLCLLIESSIAAEFIECESGQQAIKYLESSAPKPNLIISDFMMSPGTGLDLFKVVKAKFPEIPFILSTGNDLDDHPEFKNQKLTGYVQKPYAFKALLEEVKKLLAEAEHKTTEVQYVPVTLKILLQIKNIAPALYLRLNEGKYVKMVNENSVFTSVESERFRLKGAQKLYVEKKHFSSFMAKYYNDLMSHLLLSEMAGKSNETFAISSSATELISGAIKTFGWDTETANLAKKNIQVVKNIADKFDELQDIFDPKKMKENEYHTVHSMLISYLTTYFAKNYKFASPHAQEALALAAFFHDISLENHLVRNESRYAFAISVGVGMNKADMEAVRSHPERSVQMMTSWPDYLEEVLTIILQHHELPDGSGFPNKLKTENLNELSRCFIVAHHVADFYLESKDKRITLTELQKKSHLLDVNGFSDFYNLAVKMLY